MNDAELEKLLLPVSDAEPCGSNLEYDADFSNMLEAGKGTPERQFGETIYPAEPPDWRELDSKALAVLERSRDIRALASLARSRVARRGWPGFADCFAVLEAWVTNLWDHVHPQLDAEDDNDPTQRMNALLELCGEELLRLLREAPVVEATRVGSFGLRDHLRILGEMPSSPEEGEPDAAGLRAASVEARSEEVEETLACIDAAAQSFERVDAQIRVQVAPGAQPDMSRLSSLLRQAVRLANEVRQTRGISGEGSADGTEGELGETPAAAGAAQAAPMAAHQPVQMSQIRNRDDVLRILELCIDWMRENEPSSPLPMLLERARRLVSKDFLEIIEDLAPDGLDQVRRVGGVDS